MTDGWAVTTVAPAVLKDVYLSTLGTALPTLKKAVMEKRGMHLMVSHSFSIAVLSFNKLFSCML